MKALSPPPKTLQRKLLLTIATVFSSILIISTTLCYSAFTEDHPTLLLADNDAECINCHKNTIPASPPIQCKICHQDCLAEPNQSKVQPETHKNNTSGIEPCSTCHEKHFLPNHYGRHCGLCHITTTWKLQADSIVKARSCISCHEEETPPHHYRSTDCFFCHQSRSWQQTHFEHRGFERCERCHTRPKRHRSGDCIFCHDTTDWGNAS